mgnify:CR=1 FL=1
MTKIMPFLECSRKKGGFKVKNDNLKIFIEELREELHSLSNLKGLADSEVIAKSKELDEVINSLMHAM